MNGLDILKIIKERYTNIPVVMISGQASLQDAVTATKYGAYDFIEKPLTKEKVLLSVKNGLDYKRLEEENKSLKRGVLLNILDIL